MSIDLNEKYYVAKCDNKINSICKMSEEEYFKWNDKCPYGKDGGVYCTSNFKLIRATVEELIIFLKKIFPKGIQMFDTRNTEGDYMENIYCKDGIVVDYRPGYVYVYIEIFGLTYGEFEYVNERINSRRKR